MQTSLMLMKDPEGKMKVILDNLVSERQKKGLTINRIHSSQQMQ